jgi:hypothetical protein
LAKPELADQSVSFQNNDRCHRNVKIWSLSPVVDTIKNDLRHIKSEDFIT